MATTTNYNWSTPDDTSLVKDGAAAIRTLGSSIDTTTKALNPSTTLGDIEYRSSTANTNTRLGIGTSGQVLTVSGGVPSWATPTSAPTFVGARVYGSAVQSIATATYALVTWDTESFDSDGFHSTSTNTSRLTIPTGKAGKYLFNLKTVFNSTNNTGDRILYFFKNGSEVNESPFGLSTRMNLQMSLTSIQDASVGDYFEMYVFQTSGGSINLDKTVMYSEFSLTYLGA
jgi:hypothetical protein